MLKGKEYSTPAGNDFFISSMAALDLLGHVERIGAGELKDAQTGGGLAADLGPLVIDLGPQLDPGDVLDPSQTHPGRRVLDGLDDDVAELLGVAQTAQRA